jgi:4-carboxymuconolactone decarboxylase
MMDADLIARRSGHDAAAIAAREADITGRPQRIEPLTESEMSPEAVAIVAGLRAAVGLPPGAPVPEYCLTMVKHPEIFRCQMDMGTVIFKGALPPRERELAVLRIAWLLRAPYEWGEHVDIGKRSGLTALEIEQVIAGSDAPEWDDDDAAILRAVEELLSQQAMTDATWDRLATRWNEQQLIEFPMMVGQYVATALVQNTLRMRLMKNNPGLSHR